ncbi:MAG: DNA polymerase III subunit gamma/tau [Thermoleophilia bacterium]|nr:DNA polymerase III subunit gamma/tau [Thermoleophilia bacterium]
MAALYRTYRPLDFGHVIGQEAVVRTLRNAIEHDQVRQAYLFAGPRGTGKTSMARIFAKALNAEGGPDANFDPNHPVALAIANGSSLDVVEIDGASNRGIDDAREIRERAVLQPVEGGYKVYIVDEAHQLTSQAWQAMLKLIEEPPPHLVFVFCTTELESLLPTVRSRCQTFVFQRPRLQELVAVLRRVCEGESIDATDAALALIAQGAHGSFRDAVSTLDQLAAATGSTVSVQDVLQLVGGIEEDSLFRLCDMIIDRDTAGALLQVEELAEQGQDIGRLVVDLIDHLRQLLLVQHIGHVPESLPVTEETRVRLREQANQLPEPTVLRLIDLLALALDDMRQGGDARLPLELALIKVTRPQADMARESLAHRLELLESRSPGAAVVIPTESPRAAQPVAAPTVPALPKPVTPAQPTAAPAPASHVAVAVAAVDSAVVDSAPASVPALPPLELDQLRDAWQRNVVDAVRDRSIPISTLLVEARPVEISGDTLTIEFSPAAGFHRSQIEEPKNLALLADALYEVTGRRLRVETTVGSAPDPTEQEGPQELSEEDVISLLKETFDAEEVEEG